MRPARHDAIRRYRDAFGYRDVVRELEGLIAAAWPPLVEVDMGGWRVRAARGWSLVANSVWPRANRPGVPLESRLASVERFYGARGLAPCFQVGPVVEPATLDRTLAGRGYTATSAIEVRSAATEALAGHEAAGTAEVRLSREPEPRWLRAWAAAGGQPPPETAVAVLSRVRAPSAYAVLTVDGAEAVVARGVVQGGYLGVHGLAAPPPYRHRVAGAPVLGALARWAIGLGARQAYVPVDDAGADLAAAAGLRRAFRFKYRLLPRREPTGPHRAP